MTEFFHYDDLTWPEVADLPRDIPLVLPLGSSFDPEKVAAQLSHPQRLGILPFFPFGWRGRGLGCASRKSMNATVGRRWSIFAAWKVGLA